MEPVVGDPLDEDLDPVPGGVERFAAHEARRAPRRIPLRDLDLRRPIYEKTAAYGHFGREDRDFTWERTDKAEKLREAAGLTQPATV